MKTPPANAKPTAVAKDAARQRKERLEKALRANLARRKKRPG